MTELIQFLLSGFWVWAGFCISGAFVIRAMLIGWSRFLRHLNVRKHGWPPAHLDADGDHVANIKTEGE